MKWLTYLRLRIKYRAYNQLELYELNEMLLKFGRRVTHDLAHLYSETLHLNHRLDRLGANTNTFLLDHIKRKLDLWERVFYFDHGPKNYRSSIHQENDKLHQEIERLKQLCIDNGIDPTDPNESPF